MRRNLLFFITGGLLALAAVLLIRSGDDGPGASAARTTPDAPALVGTSTSPRSVRLRPHRRPQRHRPRAAAPRTAAPARPAGPATGTAAGRGAAPHPAARTTTQTTPPTTGDSPADTSTTPAPPPADGPAGTTPQGAQPVTIPNQATPDASVAAP